MEEQGVELSVIPPTRGALFKRLDWLNVSFFAIPHFFTIWGLLTVNWQWKTALFCFLFGWMSAVGASLVFMIN